MGAFDEIRYNGEIYQTKSLVRFQESYEVRDDSLWRLDYDVEDRSDPNAKGIMRICGMMTRVNERWVRDLFTGTVYVWEGPALTFEQGKLVKAREWSDEVANEKDMYD